MESAFLCIHMSSGATCSIENSFSLACLHCGAPLLSGTQTQQSRFCCRGCLAVYSLLQERGLQTYYSLKGGAQSSSAPSDSVDGEFAYLNDPDFLSAYASLEGRAMSFYLEGAHCAACVWLTEKLPEFLAEVESLKLSLATGVARVQLKSAGGFSKIAEELVRLGYRPYPVHDGHAQHLQKLENRKQLIQIGIAGMVTGNIMLLAVALYAGADGSLAGAFRWTSFALFLPIVFFSAAPFYRGALASLRRRQVSIDVPIVFGLGVGTLASVFNLMIGSPHIYFDTLSTLVLLLLSTRYFLRRLNQRAWNTSELMHFLTPSRAQKQMSESGRFESVRSDILREGDLVLVLPGECFPADGIVVIGESSVNCSLLTGEALPLAVGPNSRVNAGTLNQSAPLEVRVVHSGSSTRLGKILRAMEDSRARRAPIVSFLDRVGQAFVVAVLVLTVVGFFVGLSTSWSEAVNRALAVAIIVCPCTFALATPLAFSLAMSRAARIGVLIKDSEWIERLSQVKSIYLDKTGTLTQGELQVTSWEEILPGAQMVLVALESKSSHPVARAVVQYFGASDVAVRDFSERSGHGVSGSVQGDLFEVRGWTPATEDEKSLLPSDLSTILVAIFKNGILAGVLGLTDGIRDDSKSSVEALRKMGLDIHLISGDQEHSCQSVASRLGIDSGKTLSKVGPEEKADILKCSPFSLMVGDGANDAPALAGAYVSLAVKGGMEVSVQAAGAYSSRVGIGAVPELIRIAHQTLSVIRRNLAFAVVYNLVGIGAALTGNITPLFAAILMPLSAFTVFLSTLWTPLWKGRE